MLKIGTIKELKRVKSKIPLEVYNKIYNIIAILDSEYGADRNIDINDGGFVVFVNSIEAMAQAEKVIDIHKNIAEYAEILDREYLHAFFLRNNEFGISVIVRKELISKETLNDWGYIMYKFNGKRYMTKGVQAEIPAELQLMLWLMIDENIKKGLKMDYLQVFTISQFHKDGNVYQKIIHSQEVPRRKSEKVINVFEKAVAAKIFVIDDIDHITMLLSNEY